MVRAKDLDPMIKYAHVQQWVDQMATMCQPDSIYWCDGGDEERQRLTAQAVKTGEVVELNQEVLPGCLFHRTAANDAGAAYMARTFCRN